MTRKKFKRRDSHRKNLEEKWRRPKGRDSKLRLGKKGRGKKPSPGHGSPNKGVHPSGYREVLVRNPNDLDKIDPKGEAARISSRVGGRKEETIRERADEEEIKILN